MSMKSDKTVKKITHHVPPRQMIYTKKQNPKTTKLKLNPWNVEVRRNGVSKEFLSTVLWQKLKETVKDVLFGESLILGVERSSSIYARNGTKRMSDAKVFVVYY